MIVERQNDQRLHQHIQRGAARRGELRLGIDPAFQFHLGHNRDERIAGDRANPGQGLRLAVTQQDRDIGVDQERQELQARTFGQIHNAPFDFSHRPHRLQPGCHFRQTRAFGLRSDQDTIAQRHYRHFDIRGQPKRLMQTNSRAVAGLEGFGVVGTVHVEVYTGCTGGVQGSEEARAIALALPGLGVVAPVTVIPDRYGDRAGPERQAGADDGGGIAWRERVMRGARSPRACRRAPRSQKSGVVTLGIGT